MNSESFKVIVRELIYYKFSRICKTGELTNINKGLQYVQSVVERSITDPVALITPCLRDMSRGLSKTSKAN